MKKVYISGPMTGLPNENRDAFELRKKQMIALGFDVVSPPDLDDAEDSPGDYGTRLMRDVVSIANDCTHITFLPGSLRSRGAVLERLVAEGKGLQEIDENGHAVASRDLLCYFVEHLRRSEGSSEQPAKKPVD